MSSVLNRIGKRLCYQLGINPYKSARSVVPTTEVLLRGGLGNQLFGFAAGFELANLRDTNLHLVTRLLEEKTGTRRDFELTDLLRNGISCGPESTSRYVYQEQGFPFVELGLETRPNSLLDGYFQSARYFTRSSGTIRSLISNSQAFLEGRHSFEGRKFLAIQVRRGDYLLDRNISIHGVIPEEFFLSGLRILRNELGHLDAVVFSDSPEVAAGLARRIGSCEPYQGSVDAKPLTVLGALSAAHGFCISNSTFGWWGAFLSSPESPVLAPSPWFRDPKIDAEDIYEPHWRRIRW